MYCQTVMALPAAISPLDVSCRTVAPDDVIDWHAHWHDELCLVLDGTPTIGHAGSKLIPQDDTLFLFGESEEHGVWNLGGATARLWLLEFRINSDGCLSAFAASAWLTLQLVDITRWLSADFEVDLGDGSDEIDPQCFQLWQKIHRQVFQPSSPGPMIFGLNPCHDSLRHRFRKLFGISPQGMLIRLRMDRAKELLRTSNLSVKEIAYELGYSRQHDLTRAFHKYTGTSPSEWKMRANGFEL